MTFLNVFVKWSSEAGERFESDQFWIDNGLVRSGTRTNGDY